MIVMVFWIWLRLGVDEEYGLMVVCMSELVC